MGARVKLPEELDGLLRSELEVVIEESALSERDSIIAERYLIEKVAQEDIAAEIGVTRKTISCRLKRIIPRLVIISKKLHAN